MQHITRPPPVFDISCQKVVIGSKILSNHNGGEFNGLTASARNSQADRHQMQQHTGELGSLQVINPSPKVVIRMVRALVASASPQGKRTGVRLCPCSTDVLPKQNLLQTVQGRGSGPPASGQYRALVLQPRPHQPRLRHHQDQRARPRRFGFETKTNSVTDIV